MSEESEKSEGSAENPAGDLLPAAQNKSPDQPSLPFKPPPGFMAGFGLQISHGATPDKFVEKMQPEHISKVLDYTEEQNKREHSEKKQFFWGGLLVGVAGFLLLCWLFISFKETVLLEKVLFLFVGLVGGLFTGYGIGKKSKS